MPESSYTVLNVDNRDGSRHSRSRLLESLGYKVIEAAQGSEARRVAARHTPQLAILNVPLRDTSGIDLCRHLKSDPATASILVLQISAPDATANPAANAFEFAVDACLSEPVAPEVLACTLRLLRKHWDTQEQLRAALSREQAAREDAADARNRAQEIGDCEEFARRRLEATLQSITQPLMLTDVQGRVVSMNDAFRKLHGFKNVRDALSRLSRLGELLDVRMADGALVPPDRWPAARALRGETVTGLELHVRQRDTGRCWIGLHGAAPVRNATRDITHAVVTIEDVTERKLADRILRDNEERFRTLTQAVPGLIWTSGPDGSLTFLSDRCLEYTGLAMEQALGWGWTSCVHPDDLTEARRAWQEAVSAGRIYDLVFRLRRRDGEYRWHVVRGCPQRDAAGNIVRWCGTATDIQDQKDAEEELRAANAALQHSNDELQQFAFTISHDLQDPLRMITKFVELLSRDHGDQLANDAKEYVDFISSGAVRMQAMINGLLAYARAGSTPIADGYCDSGAALMWAVGNLQEVISETGAEVTHEGLPPVRADFGRMTQLFQNLLSNALKYRGAEFPQVHVTAVEEDGAMRFCVEDNGIGIDPAYHQRIFGVFRRLHGQEVAGTGLGLALCRRIVDRQGGRIWVESEPGKGSRFYFTWPKSELPATLAATG